MYFIYIIVKFYEIEIMYCFILFYSCIIIDIDICTGQYVDSTMNY